MATSEGRVREPLTRQSSNRSDEPDEEDQPPWGRFMILWFACVFASGVLPGQALFLGMFSEAGIFQSICGDAGYPCKDQVLTISAVMQTCAAFSMFVMLPCGMFFDRVGAKIIGSGGAAICAFGVLVIYAAIKGAQSGYDALTSWLFVIGVCTNNFGCQINSFSFTGLIWHFPKHQALVIALNMATYQVASFLPIGFETLMGFGISFENCTLILFVVVCCTAVTCWKFVPDMPEYYAEAKKVLGIPLPKPKGDIKVCEQIKLSWQVMMQYKTHHLYAGAAIMFGFAMPTLYSGVAVTYGEALFGTPEDGKRLSRLFITGQGLGGVMMAPCAGRFVDRYGLGAMISACLVMAIMSVATCPFADWNIQTICSFSQALLICLAQIFISRFVLFYAPPNRLGTVQGVWIAIMTAVALPVVMGGMAWSGMMPPGVDAFRIPLVFFGVIALPAWFAFGVFFRNNGVPPIPPLLPEDELELSRNFGCNNFEEVMQVVHIDSREELLKRLSKTDGDSLRELFRSIDTQMVMKMMAERSDDEIARMLEEGGDDDDDDPNPATRKKVSNGTKYKEVPVKEPGEVVAVRPEPKKTAFGAAMTVLGRWACLTCNDKGPKPKADEDMTEEERAAKAAHKQKIRSIGERVRQDCLNGNKEAVVQYLMTEDPDVIVEVNMEYDEYLDEDETKELDDAFKKVIPGKELARCLRERTELRSVVQRIMKHELEKTMKNFATFGKKKKKTSS